MTEPRTLDPANMSNSWAFQSLLGNALYGTLITNDVESLEVNHSMATEASTSDEGRTFTLTLRPGLSFTDGTPLDAAAVKFNWDRLRDPALGSTSRRQAMQITTTDVVDETTLKATLDPPNPHFADSLVQSSMNWIASPTALRQGQAAFDSNPVGAGPFTLVDWARQDRIDLAKNDGYWDAPKPSLDSITLRTSPDTNQRLNAVVSGAADLTADSNWSTIARAEDAGLHVETVPMGGGQFLGMNMRRAPFDDERARRAIALAVDPATINAAVYPGAGDEQFPRTVFQESSPFYSDLPFTRPDKDAAQRLFDELAAEGKPVSFTFVGYSSAENKVAAEALQANLTEFDNVEVDIEIVDNTEGVTRLTGHDFDMMITSALVQDPDAALWSAFHPDSSGNFMGVDDPALTQALDAGRNADTVEVRREAYDVAQRRLVDLNVGLWYVRGAPSVIAATDLEGILMYGSGSLLPEELQFTK
ncbi:ABC transporter substrate-binding protein [Rhodococcus sp. F64268]|uniref:ABC transporter substrate-binding protein n=1 Tax=Rhodococcus sp. F64268 TaxID=2926402 RepID=UPI001FF5696C|nr:ABC transporter substrate-binding protein [Rhodococcus sp. F64268]MCK0090508.1 ABC transporter substrate-binding protein [Rhodococcus sp. F64268]